MNKPEFSNNDLSSIDLSVIGPAFDGESNVSLLYQVIVAAVARLKLSFEIVLVDNDSRDGIFDIAKSLIKQHPRVRFVKEIAAKQVDPMKGPADTPAHWPARPRASCEKVATIFSHLALSKNV
jgi:hypothetical protein